MNECLGMAGLGHFIWSGGLNYHIWRDRACWLLGNITALFTVWFLIARTFYGTVTAFNDCRGYAYLYGWPFFLATSWQSDPCYKGDMHERWPLWAPGDWNVWWECVAGDVVVVCLVLTAVAVRLRRDVWIGVSGVECILIAMIGRWLFCELGVIDFIENWHAPYDFIVLVSFGLYVFIVLFPWIKRLAARLAENYVSSQTPKTTTLSS